MSPKKSAHRVSVLSVALPVPNRPFISRLNRIWVSTMSGSRVLPAERSSDRPEVGRIVRRLAITPSASSPGADGGPFEFVRS
ncbi:MAG: hypothetical protein U0790_07695 [Isosphaeraceae bacterium]